MKALDIYRPKLCKSRSEKRKALAEFKKAEKSINNLKEIENWFLQALFKDNGASYKEVYTFYNNMFKTSANKIQKELKYNIVDYNFFERTFKPVENEH